VIPIDIELNPNYNALTVILWCGPHTSGVNYVAITMHDNCNLKALCYSPYLVKGPGFVSISPDMTRTNLLRGAMRREGASSPPDPPPPLPLDMPSEVERRERRLIHIKGG